MSEFNHSDYNLLAVKDWEDTNLRFLGIVSVGEHDN